jgi:hypothetical protein
MELNLGLLTPVNLGLPASSKLSGRQSIRPGHDPVLLHQVVETSSPTTAALCDMPKLGDPRVSQPRAASYGQGLALPSI